MLKKIKLTEKQKEIILAYAENDMNKLQTARVKFMAKGTVEYHLNNIYDRTGYNPRKFYDLVALLYIISSEKYEREEGVV